MPLSITIDIFSGRPNPTMQLSGKDMKDFLDLIPAGRFQRTGDNTVPPPSHLGFRGVQVVQTGKAVTDSLPSSFYVSHESIYGGDRMAALQDRDAMNKVYDFIRKRSSALSVEGNKTDFLKLFKEQADSSFQIRDGIVSRWPGTIIIPPVVAKCACGPLYEPAWWNDSGQKQFNNNCYNYACNHRTDTFAQPGRATAHQYTSLAGCAVAAGQRSAKDGAISDCLINNPKADNKCPEEGHLVALVIAPGADFHWYRKGANGLWTHKPGSTPVTNVDNSGNTITDPRTANRGFYTQFCTFMTVMHGHIIIS